MQNDIYRPLQAGGIDIGLAGGEIAISRSSTFK
jgi:hypothetical protein